MLKIETDATTIWIPINKVVKIMKSTNSISKAQDIRKEIQGLKNKAVFIWKLIIEKNLFGTIQPTRANCKFNDIFISYCQKQKSLKVLIFSRRVMHIYSHLETRKSIFFYLKVNNFHLAFKDRI